MHSTQNTHAKLPYLASFAYSGVLNCSMHLAVAWLERRPLIQIGRTGHLHTVFLVPFSYLA